MPAKRPKMAERSAGKIAAIKKKERAMPYRMISFWIGLAGIIAVVVLIVVGTNLRRSAATGPAWKRRLIVAGIALLAMLGGYGGAAENASPTSAPTSQNSTRELADTAEWKQIIKAYREYGKLVEEGKSTTGEREYADELRDKADKAADQLAARRLLSESEKDILKSALNGLRNAAYRNPPMDFAGKCYKSAALAPQQAAFNRLSERLPMLEKLADGGKVHPAAMEIVIKTIEFDIVDLKAPASGQNLSAEQEKEAVKMREKASMLLEKIKGKIQPPATQSAAASQPAGAGTSNKK